MSVPYNYSLLDKEGKRHVMKEIKGVVSFNDHELLFEYKLYDLAGNALSTLNKFALELDLLNRVEFKNSWFSGGKLIFQTKQAVFLNPLPGSEQGEIKLNISRARKKDAIQFSSRLNLDMAQSRMKDMDED